VPAEKLKVRLRRAIRAAFTSDAVDSIESNTERYMDHDTLVLVAELCALFVLGGLGLWRIYKNQQSSQHEPHASAYDMRRDGQRLSSQ
jgi:hypothetical protein